MTLMEGDVDCAFVTVPSHAESEFEAFPLTADRMMVLLNEDNPLCSHESITPLDLKEEAFILPAKGANYQIGQAFADAGVPLKSRLTINDDYSAIQMVRDWSCVTTLPERVTELFSMTGIRAIPFEHTKRTIAIAAKKGRVSDPEIKAFILSAQQVRDEQNTH